MLQANFSRRSFAMLKTLLRPVTTLKALRPIRLIYNKTVVLPRLHKRYSGMETAAVFADIYAQKLWRPTSDRQFDSGSGSDEIYNSRYCELINSFITQNNVRTVIDLGCGDFRVGKKIAEGEVSYVGVDVVKDLIAHNQKTYGKDRVSFVEADVTKSVPPQGDLCLVRQVLQHLSNDEILMVLRNCRQYRYLIVTEHLPTAGRIIANIDKPHGPDTRLYYKSGVFLDQHPFSRKTTTLLEVRTDKSSGLRTSLIERPSL